MKAFWLMRSAAGTFADNKIVAAPLYLLLFLYLAALEVLYFIPFAPLRKHLGPVVQRLFGDLFLHYPHHLLLLPKLFQYAQLAVYLFFGSLLIPVAIALIDQVYHQRPASLRKAFGRAVRAYPQVLLLLTLMMTVMLWKMGLLDLLVQRAARIRSAAGPFKLLKDVMLFGAPYINLLLDIVIQTFFAAAIPAVVTGAGRIADALRMNFRLVKQYRATVFGLIFVPSLLHVPLHLLRATAVFTDTLPETTVILLAAGACVNVFVEGMVYAGLTILCLTPKEGA